MRHLSRLIGCLLSILLFSSCEEGEAPLMFDEIDNTAPSVTTFSYHGYGPFTGNKQYFVDTDFTESEIKLQCNNCSSIAIETRLEKPCVLDTGGSSTTVATPDETGIYVTLAEGNVITVRFTPLNPDLSDYGYYGTVTAIGKVDGKQQHTIINLHRTNPNLLAPLIDE